MAAPPITKNQLLLLAAFLASAGAGTIFFVNLNTGAVDRMPDSFGNFEVLDRNLCTSSACNAAECQRALNILVDAGSQCTVRFVDCPVRLGQRARNIAADAGVVFSAAKYQQVRFVVERCPSGGMAVPVDDNGFPIFTTQSVQYPCAWKNPDAGGVCTLTDGGDPGLFNTMQPGAFTGAGCQRKSCSEFQGDTSAP
jgi:hypothetical protein